MRILFLDIDGVLNSTRTCVAFGGYPMQLEQSEAFDQVAIHLLQRLCDSADVQIVLSSAWRSGYSHQQVAKAFGLPIVDRTGYSIESRGREIQDWLDAHPSVRSYAIVDDCADMLPEQHSRFVQTDAHEGLDWKAFSKLCALFGESPHSDAPRHRDWQRDAEVLDSREVRPALPSATSLC